jgi:hypothetical protein
MGYRSRLLSSQEMMDGSDKKNLGTILDWFKYLVLFKADSQLSAGTSRL